MTDFQADKDLPRGRLASLEQGEPEKAAAALARQVTLGWPRRGKHLFRERHGSRAAAEAFRTPLLQAIAPLGRPEFVMAGRNQIGGRRTLWADLRAVDLRGGDRLAESRVFIDLLHDLAPQGLGTLGRMASLDSAVQVEPWAPPASTFTAPH